MMAVYRIVPGKHSRFKLQKRVWFFWLDVAYNQSADELRGIIIECGGVIRK